MNEASSIDVRVADISLRADEVVEITLVGTEGPVLPLWDPGAHISLKLHSGLERQYSLCGRLNDRDTWRIAVLRARDGRGGSAWIHDNLRVGDVLRATLPRNHFPLSRAESYLFIAGGIGITPILPMIEQVTRDGNSWTLWYGGRSRSSMAYLDELAVYGENVKVVPEDNKGLLNLRAITAELAPGTQLYACGPEGLLNALVDLSSTWPKDTLHLERFSPIALDPGRENKPFTVHLRATGRSILVSADESILDAMAREGLAPSSSCKEGTCGTCETRVLNGAIDHRDSVLSPSEQEAGDYMMICVSRARDNEIEIDA
jgi:ferredoxin-NADP reductase